jgi:dTMP kinase
MTPLLIAIEGVDGTGKTTLARALAAALNARIIKRPIAGSPAAELIKAHRDDPDQVPTLLSALHDDCAAALKAARAYQAQGHTVILDRHYLSTAVYQGGDKWMELAKDSIQYWGEPDAWIFCQGVPSDIVRRIKERGGDQDDSTSTGQVFNRTAKFDCIPVRKHIEFFAVGSNPATCSTVILCSWTGEIEDSLYGLPDAVEWIVNQLARL